MRSEHVDEMGIGEFASRSRLSARALRIYDELGLLPPARVDEDSGYRFYEPRQLKQARLIAALRQLHFPLSEIKVILPLEPVDAAERVRQFWTVTESKHSSLRALATYLIDELSGKRPVMYEVSRREVPERSLLCVKRNITGEKGAWAFGKEFIALLRHYRLPSIEGRTGAFFQIFWGEVSEDSDGPIEWCRPVPGDEAEALAARCPELTAKVAAGALAGLAFGVLGEAIAWAVGYPVLDGRGITVVLSNGDILLLSLGGLAGTALWGAIGAGLGAIVHNQVGGVIALLAWGLVVDNILFGLAPSVGRFMPDRASDALMGLRVDHLLSPGAGAIILIAWAGALGGCRYRPICSTRHQLTRDRALWAAPVSPTSMPRKTVAPSQAPTPTERTGVARPNALQASAGTAG